MKIALLGDIALIGKYSLKNNPDVFKNLEYMSKKLLEYDYVVANLESPLTNRLGSYIPKSMHLRSSEENVEILKYLNINAVSLANNHIYDYGKIGVKDTIKTLERNGIEWFGLHGKRLEIKKRGNSFRLMGYACLSSNGIGYRKKSNEGVPILSRTRVERDFSTNYDGVSIVSIHWGEEHTNYPNYEHIVFADRFLKNRKNFVIHGHHSHVMQGIKKYDNNSICAFSLGNFLFDDCTSRDGKLVLKQLNENKKSFILELNISQNSILETKTLGFYEKNQMGVFISVEDELKHITNRILNISDVDAYNELRYSQIQKTRLIKFGKRDIAWFFSKMNFNSIGSLFVSKINKYRYNKIKKK